MQLSRNANLSTVPDRASTRLGVKCHKYNESGDTSMKENDLPGIVAEHIDAINAGDTHRNPQPLLLGEALLRHCDLLVTDPRRAVG
jgi:hypothetical protein